MKQEKKKLNTVCQSHASQSSSWRALEARDFSRGRFTEASVDIFTAFIFGSDKAKYVSMGFMAVIMLSVVVIGISVGPNSDIEIPDVAISVGIMAYVFSAIVYGVSWILARTLYKKRDIKK